MGGFIGSGVIGIKERGVNGPFRNIGQVHEFKVSPKEEKKTLKNMQGGGGNADVATRVGEVGVSMNLREVSPQNLAMVLYGEMSTLTSGTVSNESRTIYAGGLNPLTGFAPTSVTITVDPAAWAATTVYALGVIVKPSAGSHFYKVKTAGTSGGVEPTWEEDGDDTTDGTVVWQDMGTMVLAASEFEVSSGGINIPSGSTKIATTGTPVLVNYTKSAGSLVQSLLDTGKEYEVLMAGENDSTGTPAVCNVFRVKFSPGEISLIGDDFSAIPITGEALKDDSKVGAGVSKFFTVTMG